MNISLRSTAIEAILVFLSGAVMILLIINDAGGALGIVRLLLGLVFLLLIPGYFIQAALFPEDSSLSYVERLTLAIGLSLAVIPPVTLALDHVVIVDLNVTTVIGTMMVIIGASAIASWWRRAQVEDPFYLVIATGRRNWWQDETRMGRTAYVVAGGGVVAALITGALILVTPAPAEEFTEFYMLNLQGQARDFPREVNVDDPIDLLIGIVNREGETTEYHVEVFDGNTVIDRFGPFSLADGERQETEISVQVSDAGDVRLDVVLYRDEDASPYRQLQLWVDVIQPLQ